jgi:ferredoxin
MGTTFYIVYISPNGSTAKIAKELSQCLTGGGASVHVADLSVDGAGGQLIEKIAEDKNACLCIGSPVYRDLAVPPVMAFIEEIPQHSNLWAVPFVTYGRACSGVALWQMAKALEDKGIRIAAAAKVVALHAMMWQSDDPVGKGRPDADDLKQVDMLAIKLLERFREAAPAPLSSDSLDYQPEKLAQDFKKKMAGPWMVVPKTVDAEACTECGICVENCPVSAITLNPLPVFTTSCFDCFNCIRLCPEDALSPPMAMGKIEAMIRDRVSTINEQPLTRIFLP